MFGTKPFLIWKAFSLIRSRKAISSLYDRMISFLLRFYKISNKTLSVCDGNSLNSVSGFTRRSVRDTFLVPFLLHSMEQHGGRSDALFFFKFRLKHWKIQLILLNYGGFHSKREKAKEQETKMEASFFGQSVFLHWRHGRFCIARDFGRLRFRFSARIQRRQRRTRCRLTPR